MRIILPAISLLPHGCWRPLADPKRKRNIAVLRRL
jgi:hypothetical protein